MPEVSEPWELEDKVSERGLGVGWARENRPVSYQPTQQLRGLDEIRATVAFWNLLNDLQTQPKACLFKALVKSLVCYTVETY